MRTATEQNAAKQLDIFSVLNENASENEAVPLLFPKLPPLSDSPALRVTVGTVADRQEPSLQEPSQPAARSYPKEWDGWAVGDVCEVASTACSGWAQGVVTRAAPKLKATKNDGKTTFVPFDIRPVSSAAGTVVSGFVKTYQGPRPTTGAPPPIFTLNLVPHDGHGYEAAEFALAASVTVEMYPVSKCLGLRVAGERDLISLHDAVGRKLVRKVEASL